MNSVRNSTLWRAGGHREALFRVISIKTNLSVFASSPGKAAEFCRKRRAASIIVRWRSWCALGDRWWYERVFFVGFDEVRRFIRTATKDFGTITRCLKVLRERCSVILIVALIVVNGFGFWVVNLGTWAVRGGHAAGRAFLMNKRTRLRSDTLFPAEKTPSTPHRAKLCGCSPVVLLN